MDGFISYAHDDHAVFGRLRTHLRSTEQKFGLSLWHDKGIKAGQHWNKEIEEAIARASVFILLVSPAFLASGYIYGTEIPAIKRQLRACKGKAISVLLRDCAWDFAVGATQAVPTLDGQARPIEDWKPHNKGYNTARSQIDEAIAHHFGLQPRKPRWPRT